jgi:hypothetical protein
METEVRAPFVEPDSALTPAALQNMMFQAVCPELSSPQIEFRIALGVPHPNEHFQNDGDKFTC